MAKLKLANYQDMAMDMSFVQVGTNAFDPSGYGGANVNVVKTYDTDSGKVTFEYPKLTVGNADTIEAQEIVQGNLSGGKLKRYASKIAVDTSAGHLKIEMPKEVFEQAFGAKIEVKLGQPANLVGEFAAAVQGSGNLTDNVVNLDTKQVSLYYDDIHTTTGMAKARAAVLENAPERHKDKLQFGVAGGSFVLSMPVSTYEELSGQVLPVGRKVG